MKPANPLFKHPSLLLLENCKTPNTFKQIHSHMITTGLALHTYPLSRILLFSSLPPLSSSLGLSYSFTIFNQIPNPTTFLFNTLISSFATHNHTQLAFSLYFHLLNQKTPKPNNHTYPSLFKACGSHPWVPHGLALHAHVLKFLGNTLDHFVQASLLSFYSKCGKLAVCRHLFDRILNPDLPTWNSILSAYARYTTTSICTVADGCSTDLCMEALFLFNEMQLSMIRPNEITLVALISACGELGALSQGTWAHAFIERKNLLLNHFVGTSLIGMYSRCGRLDLANQVFVAMPLRDTLCYNAMIHGLAIHGHGERAVVLFDRMRSEGVMVDDVTSVVVMCACAHVGMVDEGLRCFSSMEEVYGIKPKIEHYGCLVDLLSRAGQLEEAEEVVRGLPMKPNAVLYRSLLGACRIHNNFEIGERAIANLIQLEPYHGGNYILLSNMYANINRWEDVRRVRKVMKDKGVDKTPGSSLIEMDGAMHEFVMGDRTHQHSKEIYSILDEMGRRFHECGNRSSTKEVLFDVEENY